MAAPTLKTKASHCTRNFICDIILQEFTEKEKRNIIFNHTQYYLIHRYIIVFHKMKITFINGY